MKSLLSFIVAWFSSPRRTETSHEQLCGIICHVGEGVNIYDRHGNILATNRTEDFLVPLQGHEIKSLHDKNETGVLKLRNQFAEDITVRVIDFNDGSYAVISEPRNDRLNIRDKALSYLLDSKSDSIDVYMRAATALGLASGWRWIGVSRYVDVQGTQVELLGWWENGKLQPEFKLDTMGSACELVRKTEEFCFYNGNAEIVRRFPQWQLAEELNVQAYAGQVYKLEDKAIGHVIAMHDEPVVNSEVMGDLLSMVTGFIGTNLALQEQSNATYLAREEARTDPLTGFGNRLRFNETAEKLSAEYKQGEIKDVLIFNADLDALKVVNDSFGHDAGDELILAFANIVRGFWRPDDYYFRIGGDEFILFIPNLSPTQQHLAIARMESASAQLEKEARGSRGVSFGISFLSEQGGDMAKALDAADSSMYEMKEIRRFAA